MTMKSSYIAQRKHRPISNLWIYETYCPSVHATLADVIELFQISLMSIHYS